MSQHDAHESVKPPVCSRRLRALFARYLRRYFARHFNAVRIARDGLPATRLDRPLIIYSNHPSWWDPIVGMLLADVFFKERETYGPMDADALNKYPFFRRLGVFGVERGTWHGAAQFLRTAEVVLDRPGAILYLTAEGEFRDPRRRPVTLQAGLAHLMRRVDGVVALPLALEYPFWTERLPETLVRFGTPIDSEQVARLSVRDWSTSLAEALEATMGQLAVEAQARDPSVFHSIIGGGGGVGGVYDVWRRVKARLTGKPFDAAHMEMGER